MAEPILLLLLPLPLTQPKDLTGSAMVDNFRPVQPLNERSLVVTSEDLAENGMQLNPSSTTAAPYDVYDKGSSCRGVLLSYVFCCTRSQLDLLSCVLNLVQSILLFAWVMTIKIHKPKKVKCEKCEKEV